MQGPVLQTRILRAKLIPQQLLQLVDGPDTKGAAVWVVLDVPPSQQRRLNTYRRLPLGQGLHQRVNLLNTEGLAILRETQSVADRVLEALNTEDFAGCAPVRGYPRLTRDMRRLNTKSAPKPDTKLSGINWLWLLLPDLVTIPQLQMPGGMDTLHLLVLPQPLPHQVFVGVYRWILPGKGPLQGILGAMFSRQCIDVPATHLL